MAGITSALLLFAFTTTVWQQTVMGGCVPEYAFYPPSYSNDALRDIFLDIQQSLNALIEQQEAFNDTSFALEISSSKETHFKFYHTMLRATKDSPTNTINGSTMFRIESNTKLFTALAVLKQEALGHLDLGDSILRYVHDLKADKTSFDWERITIRSLLAHITGLPDTFADDDLLLLLANPTGYGLPPVSDKTMSTLPPCGVFRNYAEPCTEKDLLQSLPQYGSVLPPHVETSYSNIGYDLLGLVTSNVSGMNYGDYISSSILQHLGLNNTSFTPPAQSAAKLPYPSAWGQATGVDAASSSDMILFVRHCLLNHDNITPSLDWFSPTAYSAGEHSFLGYAWEIFRTSSILPDSERVVTFVTKGGGGTEYYSYSIILPTYDLVVFMAAAGELPALDNVFAAVRDKLVLGAKRVAQQDVKTTCAGTYSASACMSSRSLCSQNSAGLNSSITIAQSLSLSLSIAAWISNSADALHALLSVSGAKSGQTGNVYFQFTPMFRAIPGPSSGGSNRTGEVWRFINVIDDTEVPTNATSIWDDYCVSNLDPLRYGGVSVNEVVFWRDAQTGLIEEIQIPALQVAMGR
ncbi:uncharacterized protein Z519_12209 [Cladophialophora bantiana CBS 173.52]|uniref:Beta-lactamase-related domain-containing protein n=1 Tax=Cladophialophora bantiana (strain ATCC 10958 / CBS 173.52 / CDC B-1940 / NIH 8579) TaxID=1442370 RepID=A0A0D2H1H7_CLAB1|nr:uncharacterized protein Z519_12209 [Cladophialophora bantiana CBS 173.52]KIW87098.1 hypothetical protein Z519_12209 [Cladophialophora bantiana CBS 173.52]